jgi:hypothetical protein
MLQREESIETLPPGTVEPALIATILQFLRETRDRREATR